MVWKEEFTVESSTCVCVQLKLWPWRNPRNPAPWRNHGSVAIVGKACFPSALETHWRSHTVVMPFHCPDCGKGFSDSSNLQTHQWIHMGERPLSCPECGKAFTQAASLLTYQRDHVALQED
ncbi:zinc finger protein 324A-like [Hemiscyllium ocellatum]|uniref:zinc finger protein 324A-like n=1 Tax=Hemiscyllium ocellatum TaxID=170820 RepID=UPI00296613D4|nr:zinc finger protein 324A-like [Hemiscyllium ocellatum]XP_060677495.1 zinc finger protein 324A-like [Hemiscyllium ocellatum]XP_060677496.1 zinc finger protein 324A-like [Hemiscyllium ocellatum]